MALATELIPPIIPCKLTFGRNKIWLAFCVKDNVADSIESYSPEISQQAEIQIKYSTYIQKEKELVDKMALLENLSIPEDFNYEKLVSLGNEAKQKFKKIQPRTLGQASRISGVNPSDVQILMVYMGR